MLKPLPLQYFEIHTFKKASDKLPN